MSNPTYCNTTSSLSTIKKPTSHTTDDRNSSLHDNMFLLLMLPLIQNSHSANLLGVFMYPTLSHLKIYHHVMQELSLRGHQVTVLTPKPFNNPKLTNLTEINIHYDAPEGIDIMKNFYQDVDKCQTIKNLREILHTIAENELQTAPFQNFLQTKHQKFDLIFIELFHPVMFAVARRFQAPVVGMLSMPLFSNHFEILGYPNHPVLSPDFMLGFTPGKLTLKEEFASLYFLFCTKYHHEYDFLPRAQQLAKKYFGDDFPDIGDVERSVSMIFVNTHAVFHGLRPRVPGIIEMLPLSTIPVAKLPEDLQTALDSSPEGVIYFSLGSQLKVATLEKKLQDKFLSAVAELPFKVLLKWELPSFPEKPKNVISKQWFPQSDVLAHPNVKAFVTQGGLQSLEEAIMREVPVVVLPFFADQPLSARRVVDLGIGQSLDPSHFTKDELKKSIINVARTGGYKKRIKEVRKIMFDSQKSGVKRAVWWSEYILRHKTIKHLKNPAVGLSWFQFLLLDVGLVMSFLTIIFVLCVCKICYFFKKH